MPSRLIRESLLDSPRYASRTIPQQHLFIHLLLLADDFGCLNATPSFLLRRAFSGPTKKRPGERGVLSMLDELGKAGLVCLYEHDGARFLFIPRFRQRLRAMTLRCPIPPRQVLELHDPEAIRIFESVAHLHQRATLAPLEKQGELPIRALVPVPAAPEAPVVQRAREIATRAKAHAKPAWLAPDLPQRKGESDAAYRGRLDVMQSYYRRGQHPTRRAK